MRETRITLPELVLVAGTRAALGAGLGLLLADRLSEDQRKAVGWTLFLVGALSTIPLALEVLGGHRLSTPAEGRKESMSASPSEGNDHLRKRGAFAQI
jgi:hypothetical protein